MLKILILWIIFLNSQIANAEEVSKKYVLESIRKAALEVGIEPALLWSVCYSESALKSDAYVHNDGLKNNSAFGICQVLYTTALDMGMKKDSGCNNDFRNEQELIDSGMMFITIYNPVKRDYKNCKLFGAYTNAFYAAKYLKKQIDAHNGSWISGIAAYNTGTLKICKTGRVHRASDNKVLYSCQKNGLLNQRYVDRVLDGMHKYPLKGDSNEP